MSCSTCFASAGHFIDNIYLWGLIPFVFAAECPLIYAIVVVIVWFIVCTICHYVDRNEPFDSNTPIGLGALLALAFLWMPIIIYVGAIAGIGYLLIKSPYYCALAIPHLPKLPQWYKESVVFLNTDIQNFVKKFRHWRTKQRIKKITKQ